MANIATITDNIISALSGTTSQVLLGDATLTDFKLDSLTDVSVPTPGDGDVLRWNATLSLWEASDAAGITGSGAAGQVAYFTGATTQAGSNNLFWNTANNRLGINTNTPASALQVVGTVNATNVQTSLVFSSGADLTLATQGGTSAMTIFSTTRNVLIQNAGSISDSGQRLQVVGTSYFSDSVGIGGAQSSPVTLRLAKTITGSGYGYGVLQEGVIQSNVTSFSMGFYNLLQTQATSFTLNNYYHYFAQQATLGVGSAINNQYGYIVDATLIGATNNYAFYANIPSGTGRWNLYMNGTANNYLAGSLGIGTTALTGVNLNVFKNITGSTTSSGIISRGAISSDVTSNAIYFRTNATTQAATFTLINLMHFSAEQSAFGAGSTVSEQYGYVASSTLTGATNNYGFYGGIPSGTGRWNLFMDGTASNFLSGNTQIGTGALTSEKLQVNGTMKVTGATTLGATTISTSSSTALAINSSAAACYIGMSDSSGDFNYIGSDNGALLFQTPTSSYSTKLTLDRNGNLGLGVTPSAWYTPATSVLQVRHSSFYSQADGGNYYTFIGNNYFQDSGTFFKYINTGSAVQYRQFNGQHIWYNAPSGTANATITFTQAMTLDASGRLGIGLTSPQVELTVYSAVTSRIHVQNSTSGTNANDGLQFAISGSDGYLWNWENGNILFGTNGTERGRFTTLGNLHLGTFSSDSGEKLQVTGTAKITGASTFGSSIIASGLISSATEFRLNNQAFSKVAILDAGGGFAGGYNFNLSGSTPQHSLTGAISGVYYGSGGTINFYTGTSQAAGTTATSRMSLDASGNLYVDTNTLFVDATNNKVGILTTTPSYTLDVVGSARVDGTHRIINSNSLRLTKFGIDSTSFGDIAFIDSLLISSVNGSIKLGSGNPTTFTEYLGIANGGAATFSNAVTISSGLTVNSGNITLTSLSGTGNRIVIANSTGVLSTQSTDTFLTSLTGEATSSGGGATTVTLTNSAVIGKVLTGLNVSSASITSSDSILSAFGKIQGQINGLQGGTIYKGSWNASTNTPTITSGTGTQGHYYVVTTSGTTTIDGISSWAVGDWIIYNGTVWEKIPNVDTITSVNGQTGAVTLTTSNINEGTNLYYTDARARAAISLTTTGSSGASTYSSGVLNIPTYTLAGLGGAPSTRTLTINGTTLDLSADRSWSVGTVTSIGLAVPTGFTATSAITSSGDITLGFASGYSLTTTASQTNWDTAYNRSATALAYNGSTGVVTLTKQDTTTLTATITLGPFTTSNLTEGSNLYYTDARARAAISLTTTGTSGAATYSSGVLNIPQYQSVLTNPVTGTGTAGHVAFFNGATSITGESNLFWDATNNRLGINNALPSYSLHVTGNGYFSDSVRMPNNKALTFEQTGGSILGGISMAVNNAVTLSNNSLLGVMVFDDQVMLSGKVGIGHAGNIYGGASTALSMLNTTTAPSSSFTDAFLMYSSDVVAGNAAPHFRTENGAVIKLYQETTGVGNSIFLQGGGNSVLDDSTFDGYTLRQIVKALRNQGILQ